MVSDGGGPVTNVGGIRVRYGVHVPVFQLAVPSVDDNGECVQKVCGKWGLKLDFVEFGLI